VWLANAEGSFGYKLAPPGAILRGGSPFGEGGRGVFRARLAEMLEMALDLTTVGHLLAASDPKLQRPRQHKYFWKTALGHARDVAGPK
jgi:hypothetical protein